MGCESCSNGSNGLPAGCKNHGTCSTGGCSKLAVYDWLANMDLPGHLAPFAYVEVRFKSTRKEFFRNSEKLTLNPGDAVVVEAAIGYDIGTVSAVGELARLQIERRGGTKAQQEAKRILRKANSEELAIWREARALEDKTMFKAREVSHMLAIDMKISDVEYQADKSKATFFYTAEGRIDFRELIRKLAETFRIRIEMRQIGARQEAARLGGIGSCGRELCCSTWLTDFRSVSTSAARYQQLALNTQKLAGQCGKLKCCLNYELDSYLDALKHFPKNHGRLKTKKGNAMHLKTDIFKGLLWYIYSDEPVATPIPLPLDRVKQILDLNQQGIFPEDLREFIDAPVEVETSFGNVVGQDSLTRFDKTRNRNRGGKGRKKRPGSPGGSAQAATQQGEQKKGAPRGGNPGGAAKPNRPQREGRPQAKQEPNAGNQAKSSNRNKRRKPGRGPRNTGEGNAS